MTKRTSTPVQPAIPVELLDALELVEVGAMVDELSASVVVTEEPVAVVVVGVVLVEPVELVGVPFEAAGTSNSP